jgi:hypothetical protein
MLSFSAVIRLTLRLIALYDSSSHDNENYEE